MAPRSTAPGSVGNPTDAQILASPASQIPDAGGTRIGSPAGLTQAQNNANNAANLGHPTGQDPNSPSDVAAILARGLAKHLNPTTAQPGTHPQAAGGTIPADKPR